MVQGQNTSIVLGSFPFEIWLLHCKVVNYLVYVKYVHYLCIRTQFVKLIDYYRMLPLCIFKFLSCLYYLRPLSRGTTGVVSIGPWVEKGLPN